jgi:hypothetical protein
MNSATPVSRLQKKHAEAAVIFLTALSAQQRLLGPDHPQTLVTAGAECLLTSACAREREMVGGACVLIHPVAGSSQHPLLIFLNSSL